MDMEAIGREMERRLAAARAGGYMSRPQVVHAPESPLRYPHIPPGGGTWVFQYRELNNGTRYRVPVFVPPENLVTPDLGPRPPTPPLNRPLENLPTLEEWLEEGRNWQTRAPTDMSERDRAFYEEFEGPHEREPTRMAPTTRRVGPDHRPPQLPSQLPPPPPPPRPPTPPQ
jgi:hypothetical protein